MPVTKLRRMPSLRFALCACTGLAGCGDHAGPDPDPAGPIEEIPAAIPETERADVTASLLAWDAGRHGLWAANGDAGSITFVDPDDPSGRRELVLGGMLAGIALSPDGKWIAVVDRAAGSVRLVDPDALAVRADVPVGSHPRAAVFDPAAPRWLYVTVEDEDAVAIVDRSFARVVGQIAVGPLPAALAASGARSELVVFGRTDGRGYVIARDERRVAAVVPLADAPVVADPKKPQGRPYGFEGLAFSPDGTKLWVPHMLYSGGHPIQFQSTVFPAVSVIDLTLRQEVSNEGAPKAKFPGRKMLFDAINVLGDTGRARVVSQPCAAATHPGGLRAYVLACGSEDLVVFDVPSGRATEIIDGLPGDHPAALLIEPGGARAFVLADQSHTLATIDLAHGDVLGHPAVVGEPVRLVAEDPVAAPLRRGKTLFLRANEDKGDLATTGDSWMSCNACHLDGFVSTNLFLLEASRPDAADDALIGHHRLRDLFATAPDPDGVAFDAHDILAAFEDQGGLAPDRTGEVRAGAVDLAAPTDTAVAMARDVARVIALDLPLGPSWLLPARLDVSEKDGAWCGQCHQKEYDAWTRSAHAHAAQDPFVGYVAAGEAALRGPAYVRLCQGCHDPTGLRAGQGSLSGGAGVTCLGCHDVGRLVRAGGNADLEAVARDWSQPHKGAGKLDVLRRPEFCGGCHQQFVPGHALRSIDTLTEWQASPFHASGAGGIDRTCVDCHMKKDDEGTASHAVVGGNLALAQRYPVPGWEDAIRANLATAALVDAAWQPGGVEVEVKNAGAGHLLPTGVADIREMWTELRLLDAGGAVLSTLGGPDASGLLADVGPRLGMDVAKEDGTLLRLHELSQATQIPFDRRVPPGGSVKLTIPVAALPPGWASAEVHLYYRNLRPPFYRAALGDPGATPPAIELAAARVSGTP
jgi:YVTN family beta-propeller protein